MRKYGIKTGCLYGHLTSLLIVKRLFTFLVPEDLILNWNAMDYKQKM